MFSVGDEARLGEFLCNIVEINWQQNEATVRFYRDNRTQKVHIDDLQPSYNGHRRNYFDSTNEGPQQSRLMPILGATGDYGYYNPGRNGRYGYNSNNMGNSGYRGRGGYRSNNYESRRGRNLNGTNGPNSGNAARKDQNGDNAGNDGQKRREPVRKNGKLSEESLRKLPHLRKHIGYIKSIDMNLGPKDYNQFRLSKKLRKNKDGEDSKDENGNDIDGDRTETDNGAQTDSHGRISMNNLNNNNNMTKTGDGNDGEYGDNNGNLNNNNGNKRNMRRKRPVSEKGDLFKTELCENWVVRGSCTYGKKCHFAHGHDDLRNRLRVENYKTQPCCDPARSDSLLCLFGKRCNYTHPGEALRRPS